MDMLFILEKKLALSELLKLVKFMLMIILTRWTSLLSHYGAIQDVVRLCSYIPSSTVRYSTNCRPVQWYFKLTRIYCNQ